MSLESYLRAAPKAELHVHLEGAIRPATLIELARRNGRALPADTVEGLRARNRFRDFPHFVEMFVAGIGCLRTIDDYELIACEFGAEMARQNVRYAELTFTPSTHAWMGTPHDVWFGGITRGRERAEAEFGVRMRWVFDLVRWSEREPETTLPKAEYGTDAAIAGANQGVVALGLGGDEARGEAERFAPFFERARAAGLRSNPHAGEHAGPESIWAALRLLGADRISHGVRAGEDPALVEHLAQRQTGLALAPTSNISLGVYPSLAAHPLRRLHEAGVAITINSDDPPLFDTTLNDEAALLGGQFGLDAAAIDEILLNGVRHSFLPSGEKQQLEAEFRTELRRLKAEHLGTPDGKTLRRAGA